MRYSLEPRELLNIYREIDQKNWQLLAVYHSHPRTEAYPSPTDIKLAELVDAVYIIVSLRDPVPAVRAFRLSGGQVQEEIMEAV